MSDEKAKFQMAGLRWLYEMELVNDPQLINNLKLNIFSVSNRIREVELLSSYHHKSMLVFIDVSWIGRVFLKKRIIAGVEDRLTELLPNFRFRVTTEREIFEMALEQVKSVLKGGPNEEASANPNSTDSNSSTS